MVEMHILGSPHKHSTTVKRLIGVIIGIIRVAIDICLYLPDISYSYVTQLTLWLCTSKETFLKGNNR